MTEAYLLKQKTVFPYSCVIFSPDNMTCLENYTGENDKRVWEGHILAVAIHLVMSPVDISQGSHGPRTSPGDLLIFQPRASTHLLQNRNHISLEMFKRNSQQISNSNMRAYKRNKYGKKLNNVKLCNWQKAHDI